MSKPSYAAVAASPPKDTHLRQEPAADAPPPYSGPSVPVPAQSVPPSHVPVTQSHAEAQHFANRPSDVWTPPPNASVARSRALRRFWVAFLWAWVIYILAALVIGGGVSDVSNNPPGRKGHWGKHGKWHNDAN